MIRATTVSRHTLLSFLHPRMLRAIAISLLVVSAAAQTVNCASFTTCATCQNVACQWCTTPTGGSANSELAGSGSCIAASSSSTSTCPAGKMTIPNAGSCFGTTAENACAKLSSSCSNCQSAGSDFVYCDYVQPTGGIPAFCDRNANGPYPSDWTVQNYFTSTCGASDALNQALGLATGALVGIIIGGILLLILIIVGIMACFCGGIYCCVKANQPKTQGGIVLTSSPARVSSTAV